MSSYCSAKAGMDMFMQCLTLDHPEIRTLCYSPGPMDTPMGADLTNKHGNQEVREHWENLRKKETIVKPLYSAEQLLNILQKGEFKSGDFVDVMGRNKDSF
jgi:Dehydrogenases with different specificities (related to short-chain alcohol dehydrogenases)